MLLKPIQGSSAETVYLQVTNGATNTSVVGQPAVYKSAAAAYDGYNVTDPATKQSGLFAGVWITATANGKPGLVAAYGKANAIIYGEKTSAFTAGCAIFKLAEGQTYLTLSTYNLANCDVQPGMVIAATTIGTAASEATTLAVCMIRAL
jgi:hypothetical protein